MNMVRFLENLARVVQNTLVDNTHCQRDILLRLWDPFCNMDCTVHAAVGISCEAVSIIEYGSSIIGGLQSITNSHHPYSAVTPATCPKPRSDMNEAGCVYFLRPNIIQKRTMNPVTERRSVAWVILRTDLGATNRGVASLSFSQLLMCGCGIQWTCL